MNGNCSMKMKLNRDLVRDSSYRIPNPKKKWFRDAFLSSTDQTHMVKRHWYSIGPENLPPTEHQGVNRFKAAKRTPSNRINST
uniref:Uncharacterized protein n=1 Tax=Arundo donax TaxID=35708 RepID=A0A0A9FN55_ARUDO